MYSIVAFNMSQYNFASVLCILCSFTFCKENDLVLKFLPALMSLLVDDQMRIVNRRLNDTADDTDLKSIPPFLLKYIRRNKIGATLILYYVLHVTSKRNKEALARILPNIVKTESDLSFNDIFLHPFVAQLSVLLEEFFLRLFLWGDIWWVSPAWSLERECSKTLSEVDGIRLSQTTVGETLHAAERSGTQTRGI